ncbi:hypothetical protein BMS3Abin07_00281 [bacterium BMS3Abin07]|nr:hypothetical protein BMS3Abin07_00281 [bacterium BMS3Abin07]
MLVTDDPEIIKKTDPASHGFTQIFTGLDSPEGICMILFYPVCFCFFVFSVADIS